MRHPHEALDGSELMAMHCLFVDCLPNKLSFFSETSNAARPSAERGFHLHFSPDVDPLHSPDGARGSTET